MAEDGEYYGGVMLERIIIKITLICNSAKYNGGLVKKINK